VGRGGGGGGRGGGGGGGSVGRYTKKITKAAAGRSVE